MQSLYEIWQQHEEHQVKGQSNNTLIIDNRTVEEYATGHVPGSQNIPLGDEPQYLNTLKDYDLVYLYCHSGRRSQTALTNLSILGLDNMTCVSHSGLPEWIQLGYPIE